MKYPSEMSRFLLGALIIGISISIISINFHLLPLWAVAISVYVIAIVTMLTGTYISLLRRIHEISIYKRDGWIYRLLSGRLLFAIGWFAYGVLSAFFMMVQLNLYTWKEWGVFALTFPIFIAVYLTSRSLLARHLDTLHVTRIAITWTRRLVPFLMALVLVIAWDALPNSDEFKPETLKESIENKRGHLAINGGAIIVDEALRIYSTIDGTLDFANQGLAELSDPLAMLASAIALLAVSYNVCLLMSVMSIPLSEYRRLVTPTSEISSPPPMSPIHVFSLFSVVTFISVFVYLYGFVALETSIRSSEKWQASRIEIEEKVIVKVDEIAGVYYKPGTIRKLESGKIQAWKDANESVAELERQIDYAFASMELNVDGFLDWYYSLSAEYVRIGMTLTGNIDGYMQNKLADYLNLNDPFSGVTLIMSKVVSEHRKAADAYRFDSSRILAENKLEIPSGPFKAVHKLSEQELFNLSEPPVAINLNERIGGSAALSATTAVITQKVVAKISAKGIYKSAAAAAAKLLATKAAGGAAGAAAGAATGAAIGSVIPGPGTAVGAVAGAAVGLLAGFSLDAALLSIEEMISREEFRREILESIASAKMEYLRELHD